MDGVHNADLAHLLTEQGIAVRAGHHCAMPLLKGLGLAGAIRVSLALYNDSDDLERFFDALDQALELLQSTLPAQAQAALDSFEHCSGWEQRARLLMQWGQRLPELSETDKPRPTAYMAVKALCGWWASRSMVAGSLRPAVRRG